MKTTTFWYPLTNPDLGLSHLLSQNIVQIEKQEPGIIPDLRQGNTLCIGSDYGGMHQSDKAKYEIISFIVADETSTPTWNYLREIVRQSLIDHHSQGERPREMAYKKLRDGIRLNALKDVLKTANILQGLSFTVAIDKRIKFLTPEARNGLFPKRFSRWEPEVFDRLMRVAHFLSLLMAGLSYPGQDVIWITDEDQIVANEEKMDEAYTVLSHVSKQYLPHPIGTLQIGTNKEDHNFLKSDYLAIPDLITKLLL